MTISSQRSQRGAGIIVIGAVLWLAAVTYGFSALWRYKLTPGAQPAAPVSWPSDTTLERGPGSTLVLLAHPRCPCTRATLRELTLAMTAARGKARAYILFIKPEGTAEEWALTDTFKAAEKIPSSTVLVDLGGKEAARFGSKTSGHALLYAPDGSLQFSGGLTFARGHEGENAGRAALVSFLRDGRASTSMTSVFGCSLQDSSQTKSGGRS